MAAAGAGSSNLADVFYADWIDSKSTAGATLWGPSGVAISSAPTRHLIYAATGNTYSDPPQVNSDAVLAFDMTTGKIRWSKQDTPNDTFLSACRGGGNPNCPERNGPDFDFGNAGITQSSLVRNRAWDSRWIRITKELCCGNIAPGLAGLLAFGVE
jgi:hypothetical protein